MPKDKTALAELVMLYRMRQASFFSADSPYNGFSEVSAGEGCPLGCDCLPWDFCDCVCHRYTPTKRRPSETGTR